MGNEINLLLNPQAAFNINNNKEINENFLFAFEIRHHNTLFRIL